MPAGAIDAALDQQASDVIGSNRGGVQHGRANTLAEVARFGNDADDDKFGRGFARQASNAPETPEPPDRGPSDEAGPDGPEGRLRSRCTTFQASPSA